MIKPPNTGGSWEALNRSPSGISSPQGAADNADLAVQRCLKAAQATLEVWVPGTEVAGCPGGQTGGVSIGHRPLRRLIDSSY